MLGPEKQNGTRPIDPTQGPRYCSSIIEHVNDVKALRRMRLIVGGILQQDIVILIECT